MTEHNTVTDPEIHEPKGASSANSGETYVSDGAGSGSWTNLVSIVPLLMSGSMADVSTANTVYVPISYSGAITKFTSVIEGAPSGGSASTITIKNSVGTTIASVSVPTTSVAGDIFSVNMGTGNSVNANDYITVESDGATTTAASLKFSIVLERS